MQLLALLLFTDKDRNLDSDCCTPPSPHPPPRDSGAVHNCIFSFSQINVSEYNPGGYYTSFNVFAVANLLHINITLQQLCFFVFLSNKTEIWLYIKLQFLGNAVCKCLSSPVVLPALKLMSAIGHKSSHVNGECHIPSVCVLVTWTAICERCDLITAFQDYMSTFCCTHTVMLSKAEFPCIDNQTFNLIVARTSAN